MYGDKISAIRLSRGFTQEYVSSKVGIAQNTYSNIEKNKTSKIDDEVLNKIANVLGVSIEDIKSPTPIVMSFHNSPQSGQYNTNTSSDQKVIDALLNQLKIKDEQLAQKDQLIKDLIKGLKYN